MPPMNVTDDAPAEAAALRQGGARSLRDVGRHRGWRAVMAMTLGSPGGPASRWILRRLGEGA
jgi:hypothetical protein